MPLQATRGGADLGAVVPETRSCTVPKLGLHRAVHRGRRGTQPIRQDVAVALAGKTDEELTRLRDKLVGRTKVKGPGATPQ